MLESDYISQLNQVKNADTNNILNDIKKAPTSLSPIKIKKGETKKEKDQRQELYMNNLISSKHEEMKRKLLDLIDNIHREEQVELEEDLDQVKGEMRDWQKKC